MKITSLTVGGFKGIKTKAVIPLAPITLFFGANSTGKSTVLHALLYLYEVVAKRNFDAQYSSIAGQALYFGGFQNLVHGKDLNGTITIGATLDFRDGATDIWDEYLSDSERWLLESYLGFTPDSEADEFNFELDIRWDHLKQKTFVSRYECNSKGNELCCIESQPGKQQSSITHYQPLPHWEVDESFSLNNLFDSGEWEEMFLKGQDALPNIYTRLDLSNAPFSWNKVFPDHPLAAKLFAEATSSQAILAPMKLLVKKLEDFIHIGPLRVVPNRSIVLNSKTSPQRWYDGTAGWETFAYSNESVKAKTNEKFTNNDFFGTNYCFEAPNHGEASLIEKTVILKDSHTNIHLLPSSVGVGVSQVFPFVVATSLEQDLIVSCEQPELHIHPKWQLALGDMMIEAVKNNPDKMFLIETHSEHLMLRLLRRTIDEGTLSITPDEISVINVFKNDDEIHYQRQRITDSGDFELDWPEGFFEERYGEV